MTAIWTIATDARDALIGVQRDVAAVARQITEMKSRQDQLWEKWEVDHNLLMKDDYKLDIDHDWISAHVHANEAVRELAPVTKGAH